MSVGWGFRGDYGHEAGAMVPGALIGLAVCLASGREDWHRRGAIMGLCGAIGWAFGGQMSYGRIIGYTASSSLLDVSYGYGCLFLIGGLWGGIGSAFLAMSVTESRSYLERFSLPLIALFLGWWGLDITGKTDQMVELWYLNDTDWVAALSALIVAMILGLVIRRVRSACLFIATLAASWWAGYLLLTVALGLHMTPPRSDNWSGCLGLFTGLLAYLLVRRNRAAVAMAVSGFLFGGLGFALGDFVHMLGRAQWGPIGTYSALQGLDYWKWMEQLFGLIMGLGVATAFLGTVRSKLAPPLEDRDRGKLSFLAWLFLMVVMMWSNLQKNVETWIENEHIPARLMGIDAGHWFGAVGVLLTAFIVAAIVRGRLGRLALAPSTHRGRAQLLFLLILWIAIVAAFLQALPRMAGPGVLFVHMTFWITAAAGSFILLVLPGASAAGPGEFLDMTDPSWKLDKRHWIALLLIPELVFALACLGRASHQQDLPGSQLRFPAAVQSTP